MNGRKTPGWKQLNAQRSPYSENRWIAASAMILLCTAFPFNLPLAHAQESANRITDISVSPKGELIIEVDGEGFDPMLRLEPVGNGEYRIVVQGEGVTLNPDVSQSATHLGQDLQGRIPAIDKAALTSLKPSSLNASGTGFQLVLTSWRKLQPQILINNGSQIVISLIGERSVPQAVLLQRKRIEQQRLATLKKQEALKKQAERQQQLALQHQAELKRQAEIAALARQKLEAEQRRIAELKQQELERQQALSHQKALQRESNRPIAVQPQRENPADNAETDDDFAALKRQEAQRLAAQQRQALAQLGQVEPMELEAQAPRQTIGTPKAVNTSLQPAEKSTPAKANTTRLTSAKTTSPKGHLQSLKQLSNESRKNFPNKTHINVANSTASTRAATEASTASIPRQSTSQSAEWKNAYMAQNPMSANDFMAEMQVAQQAGKAARTRHNMTQELAPSHQHQSMAPASPSSPMPANAPAPSAPAQPGSSEKHGGPQILPVNFSGPTGTPADDLTPTNPLRLQKLPPNYAPEPDPDAPPTETPMNLQPTPEHLTPGRSPGATAQPLDTIYAVINQPNADPSLKQAWQALMGGNAPGAQEILRQHINLSPKDANARYLLAEILMSPLSENAEDTPGKAAQELSNRRKEAQRQLLTNYTQSLHWPSCQALLEMFLDEGKLQEANGLLQQVKKAYPKQAGIAYEEGRLQEAMNHLDAARKAYQTALGLQAANPEIHYRLAQVELKAGHLDAARWELLQALTWSPNDSRLYKLLGYIADKAGQGHQAAQAYRQALPVDALINYARTLEAQHQPDRALSLYQAAEALAGDNGDVLYNLAMIYSNTHRPARATAVLQRFLSLKGSSQDARTAKAKAMLQQLKP